MDGFRNFLVAQADYLLFLHGLTFVLVASVSLALARLDREGLPWRSFAAFAVTWGITEWLEMIFIGVDGGPALPLVQMALALLALLARAHFARAGAAALGGRKLGPWVVVAFGMAGVSGALGGTQGLWISLDSAAALASFWDIWVLARYRKVRHPGSVPLLVALGGLGFYTLGTAIPVLHITWFLPGVAGGWPEGQVLWILSSALVGLGLIGHYSQIWRRLYPERAILPPGLTHGRLVASTLLILAAGWGAVLWGDRTVVREEKEDLLHKAQLVAIALNPVLLDQLEGTLEDALKPAYQRLRARVRAATQADPDLRFVYILVPRDGGLRFALDSAPETSPDYSPPGSSYQEAPPALSRAFSEARPLVVGPFTDRWGTFISAFVPVRDPATSRVRQVLGVDVEYATFRARVASQRLAFILMTLLVAVIQIGAFTFRQMGRESEEALEAVEQRYRHMFQGHSAAMLLVDPESGRIVDCNKAACAFYGCERGQLVARSIFDLNTLAPESIRAALSQALHGQANRFLFQHRARGGSLRDVEVYSVPIRSGPEVFLFSIIHDITDRIRAEADKKELEARVLQAQKMESLGVLAGGIAHDFNNILQGILGNADLAIRSAEGQASLRRRLEGIRESSERAADLCKLMLAYSGKGAFSVGPLDLGALVRETVQMVRVSISKKVAVELHLAQDLPTVEGDAAQIRQVVMNLLINASEAMGEGAGTISVTVRPEGGAGVGEGGGEPRDRVLLEVADTGAGMDEVTRARIFEPFFTTKFKGRGLGLAAVQGIVRSHGGDVSVSSIPGEGTLFRVRFPAAVTPCAPQGNSGSVPALQKFRGRILLVDDEAEVRDVGTGMLEHLGFSVTATGDGPAALKLLADGERFDAVLLDMAMPQMDGMETLELMRGARPDLPVILVSGYDEREISRQVSVAGFGGFLHKPFSLDALAKAVALVLGGGRVPSFPAGGGDSDSVGET